MSNAYRVLGLVCAVSFPCVGAAADSPAVAALRALAARTGETYVYESNQGCELSLGKKTTDADLRELAKLPAAKIWKINLAPSRDITATGREVQFTRAGVKELAKLPDLRWLRVPGTFKDDDVKDVAALKGLETLLLFWCDDLTDNGLTPLKALPKLRELDVTRAKLTDACWEPLSKLSALEALTVADTKVTGKGIGRLAAGPKLRSLDLSYTKLTDANMPEIGRLKSLRKLDAQKTLITDRGLKELAGLKDLQQVDLSGTKVTPAGVEALKKALPRCRVER